MTANLKAAAAIAVTLAISSATVHAGLVHRICASKGVIASAVTIKLSTGCVSSTTAVIGHDFIVKAREDGSTVDIIGGFKHRNPGANIGTADCMGARSLTFDVVGLNGKSVEVIENGTSRGVIALADAAGEQCLDRNRVTGNSWVINPAK